MRATKDTFNIGDLVEVIDIGEGSEEFPWTEEPVAAIYMGLMENKIFGYNPIVDLSTTTCSGKETWHKVWYRGKVRYLALDKDLKLLSSHNT